MFSFTAINQPAAANGQRSTANASNVRGRKRGRSCECFDNRTVKNAELVVNHLCDHRRERKVDFGNPNRIPIANRLARPRNNGPTFSVFDPARDPVRNIVVDRNGNQVNRRAVASQPGPSRRREPIKEPEAPETVDKAPTEPSEGSYSEKSRVMLLEENCRLLEEFIDLLGAALDNSSGASMALQVIRERYNRRTTACAKTGRADGPPPPPQPETDEDRTAQRVPRTVRDVALPLVDALRNGTPFPDFSERDAQIVRDARAKHAQSNDRSNGAPRRPVVEVTPAPLNSLPCHPSRPNRIPDDDEPERDGDDDYDDEDDDDDDEPSSHAHHSRSSQTTSPDSSSVFSPPCPEEELSDGEDTPRPHRNSPRRRQYSLRMPAVIPSIERDEEGSDASEESSSPQQTPCPGPSRKRCAAIASGPEDSPKMRIIIDLRSVSPDPPEPTPRASGPPPILPPAHAPPPILPPAHAPPPILPPASAPLLIVPPAYAPQPILPPASAPRPIVPASAPDSTPSRDRNIPEQRARELSEQRRARARAKSEQRRALEDSVRNWHRPPLGQQPRPTAAPRVVKPPATAQQGTPPSIRERPQQFRRMREESIDFASTANRMAALPKIIEQHFCYD
ncbi:hypothetical protein MBM_05380 [Drepanopeziza brunnea f. sp. 'multigermtubi' MB_m1]|uniref:Uncharacterized protein n=1 Tax=Marssonina brunnea f. sp. multigermtubi (strain MB_m1) TaxID=1072389 RepID=K1WV22_MARBU|nr:uncharacterized protein MBM_05380 [Drepanopeziza brunnea f. sp. 'multigermtubi' MB_m1]EKD16911.1 hypothetical protein MBM_05380 [Drepanopeziza brunnea f. sp. 'multigermtubi' MB_m1]